MINLNEFKSVIEKSIIALATVMENSKANAIAVGQVKVISEDEVLITDNYMNQTVKDILANPSVCLLFWDENFKGYKLIGQASYYNSGAYKERVGQMEENKDYPAKGAIVVKIEKIIASS